VLAGVQRLLVVGMLCVQGNACGFSGTPASDRAAVEEQLQSAIVVSTGYPAGSIQVLASPIRVSVSISDSELARGGDDAREHIADTVVAAVEKSIAIEPRMATIAEIRVVIVHPEEGHGLLSSTHTEEAMEFKKGSNQQFHREVL
jgi:hypothetical protein